MSVKIERGAGQWAQSYGNFSIKIVCFHKSVLIKITTAKKINILSILVNTFATLPQYIRGKASLDITFGEIFFCSHRKLFPKNLLNANIFPQFSSGPLRSCVKGANFKSK